MNEKTQQTNNAGRWKEWNPDGNDEKGSLVPFQGRSEGIDGGTSWGKEREWLKMDLV